MGIIKVPLIFEEHKTNKKDWEDTECFNCRIPLWEPGIRRTAYVWQGNNHNAYLQLCGLCVLILRKIGKGGENHA